MLFPQLEEKLQASKQALNTATSENIIEQCKQHLALLAEYRIQTLQTAGPPRSTSTVNTFSVWGSSRSGSHSSSDRDNDA
jgi:hypothetical protein